MTHAYNAYTIDAETVEDIEALPAEYQHLAWSLLARYGLDGHDVTWQSSDTVMAYVCGALARAKKRIDASRTQTAQTTAPTPTPAAAAPARPAQKEQTPAAPVHTTPTPAAKPAAPVQTTQTTSEPIYATENQLDELDALTGAEVSRHGGPSIAEVRHLWSAEGYKGDPDHFWCYYEAARWTIKGKNIYSWRAVARKWSSGEKSGTPRTAPTPAVQTVQTQPQTDNTPTAEEQESFEAEMGLTQTDAADKAADAAETEAIAEDLAALLDAVEEASMSGKSIYDDDDDEMDTYDLGTETEAQQEEPEAIEIDDLAAQWNAESHPNKMLGSNPNELHFGPEGEEVIHFDISADDLPF